MIRRIGIIVGQLLLLALACLAVLVCVELPVIALTLVMP